ncbi:t-SNARE [Entophlyctis helioformis]|nr:t-SNARE [Entophlyctis helioformis]
MRDRLQDLQSDAPPEPEPDKKEKPKKQPKVDKKAKDAEAESSAAMQGFFDELAQIKDQIAMARGNVDEIRAIHDRALNNVISEQQNAQIAKELDATMDKTNKISGEIRNKLKAMDAENKAMQKKDPSSSDAKIRVSQHGVLTKSFLEVMMEYKKIQEMYQDKYKDRMQRQCLIVKPNATEEEMKQMMDGDKGQMFSKQIMNTGQRQEARKALEDIQNKHKDVMRIEKSILELQQLFMDMAVLTSAQGQIIDQIAVHIDNAANDTEQGVQHLVQATKLQKKTRKACPIPGNVCSGRASMAD